MVNGRAHSPLVVRCAAAVAIQILRLLIGHINKRYTQFVQLISSICFCQFASLSLHLFSALEMVVMLGERRTINGQCAVNWPRQQTTATNLKCNLK